MVWFWSGFGLVLVGNWLFLFAGVCFGVFLAMRAFSRGGVRVWTPALRAGVTVKGVVLVSFDGRAALDGLVAARSAPAAEPVGVDAVQLARDVVLSEQEFRRSASYLSGEAAESEGRGRGLSDWAKGLGWGALAVASVAPWGTLGKLSRAARAGRDVFEAGRAVEAAGDVGREVGVLGEVASPFGAAIPDVPVREALNAFEEWRLGTFEGGEQIRALNTGLAGARLALFNAGRNPSDDLGRFVVSEFTDFSIDPKKFPFSEDFLLAYSSREGVPASLSSRLEDLDMQIFADGDALTFSDGGSNAYQLFHDEVQSKARLGKYESENYPRFFPAFRGRTPAYGPFVSDDDAVMLIRDSVAMDALAQSSGRRSGVWSPFYEVAKKISRGDISYPASLAESAKRVVDFAEDYIPGSLVAHRIVDALRLTFEPRVGPDTRHLLRVPGSSSKPDFLWFGLFNNKLAIQRLEEAKSMLPSVSPSEEYRAIDSLGRLMSAGGDGQLGMLSLSLDVTGLASSSSVGRGTELLQQNEVARMFGNILSSFSNKFDSGFTSDDVSELSDSIDSLISVLSDEASLFSKMVTRGFSDLAPVRNISVSRVEGIEAFDSEVVRRAATGQVVGVDDIKNGLASEGMQVPNGIVNAVRRGYKESADSNQVVSVFSPFADADLAGAPLYAARVVRASDTNMTAVYATDYSDMQSGQHGTLAQVQELLPAFSEEEASEKAANLLYDTYNTRLNQDIVNGWAVPSSDVDVNLAGRRDFAVVVKHIPIIKDDEEQVWSSVAEIEWYRLFNSKAEAEKWAVSHGNREIVDVKTSNLLEIDEDEAESIALSVDSDYSRGYFLPNYKRGKRDISVLLDAPEQYDAELTGTLRYRSETGRPSGLRSKGVWADVIAKLQGFDGLPSIVDSTDYRNLLAEGWRPVFRGIQPTLLETEPNVIPQGSGWSRQASGAYVKRYGAEDYFDDFISGEYSSGRGIYSYGYYFAEEFGTSLTYAADGNGVVIAGLLPPYANMAPTSFGQFFWQLDSDYQLALLDTIPSVARMNPEMALVMLGYDGAYTNVQVRGGFSQLGRRPEMVLYNRSMLAVYEKPIRVRDFSSSIPRAIEAFPDLGDSRVETSFTWISRHLGPIMPQAISDGVFDFLDIPRRDVSEWTITEIT